MSFNPPQITGVYKVTGVPTKPNGQAGTRLELRTLKKDEDLWNLFLMGLWVLQKVPQYRDLSFYKLAGIHGKPYVPWPPRDKTIIQMQKMQKGYCTHSSIVFLPWHRPYLALYEQMIYEGMKYVANLATEAEGASRYKAKLETWRLPYWDWAASDLAVFPEELLTANTKLPVPAAVRVEYNITGTDKLVDMPNPLYRYEFGSDTAPEVIMLKSRFSERYGRDVDSSLAYQEVSEEERRKRIEKEMTPYSRSVNSQIRPEGNLRERVVYLIQSYDTFETVSHNQWDPTRVNMTPPAGTPAPPPGTSLPVRGLGFGSIEDIHNSVHGLVGGRGKADDGVRYNGHMSQVEVASFDPVFWLHHCNIDRCFALWQALHDDLNNPETYVTKHKVAEASWDRDVGDWEDVNTKLIPFYQSETKFWDSNGVRDTANLGYVYPETQKWKFNSVASYRTDVMKQIDTLYPNSSFAIIMTNVWHDKEGGKDSEAALMRRGQRLNMVTNAKGKTDTGLSLLTRTEADSPLPPVPAGRNLKTLCTFGNYDEFMFNIKAPKHAMNGRYTVHCFIGTVEETNTSLYTVSPNHIGTFSPLGQASDTQCGKCQTAMEKGEEVTGQIPLTIALVERYFAGFLDDIEIETVKKYLTTELHWEVVDEFGNRLTKQRDKLIGLKVSVSSNEVTMPEKATDLPKYSQDVYFHYAITTNPDGSGRGEGTGLTQFDLYTKAQLQSGEGVVGHGGSGADGS